MLGDGGRITVDERWIVDVEVVDTTVGEDLVVELVVYRVDVTCGEVVVG
jgi:hypothetical protein